MTPLEHRLARLEQGRPTASMNALVMMSDAEPVDTHRGAIAMTKADSPIVFLVRFIDAPDRGLDKAGDQQ